MRSLINFMAITKSGPMFLNSINADGEVKNCYITKKLEDCIKEVGAQNVIQIITDNASACKAASAIVESKNSHIFWTLCAVHTLNLTLKNIFMAKKMEANVAAYAQCSWIMGSLMML